MKILCIIPGSGDSFYCGNCFRDNLQASALRKAGHEVIIMPLYLPLKHETFSAGTPLFFPATTYYVAQKFFVNRGMPEWLKRVTGSTLLLNVASSLSGATSAGGMENMTLSMIRGHNRAFGEYAQPLIDWIADQYPFDIIHLSSSLLLGIAKAIKERFALPIVCSLQDEEIWIDGLNKDDATDAWQGIEENLRYIDRLITTSTFYRDKICRQIPEIKNIHVVYPGIERSKYVSGTFPDCPTIGFFYRMNKLNGLDILADAFVKLKEKNSIKKLKLKIGGGYTGEDKSFMKRVRKTLAPYMQDVSIHDSYDLNDHTAFYKEITIISVPITFNESVGLYLCEAFAAGRPAVEPATGSFPEIVGDAGILYKPNNSEALANAIETLLLDPPLLERARESALQLSETRYNNTLSAREILNIYNGI